MKFVMYIFLVRCLKEVVFVVHAEYLIENRMETKQAIQRENISNTQSIHEKVLDLLV